jgi:hypothetical protein
MSVTENKVSMLNIMIRLNSWVNTKFSVWVFFPKLEKQNIISQNESFAKILKHTMLSFTKRMAFKLLESSNDTHHHVIITPNHKEWSSFLKDT